MSAPVDLHEIAGAALAMLLDREGRICEATAPVASLLDRSADELCGLRLGDIVPEQWRTMADAATARILCGDDRPFQLMLAARSGRCILTELAAHRIVQSGWTRYLLAWSEHVKQPVGGFGEFSVAELRHLANRLLQRREAERRRLAGELENEILPLVAVAKLMAEDAHQRFGTGGSGGGDLLREASNRLREAVGELQRLATELRPPMLDELGLVATIEWLCRRFDQSQSLRIERQIRVRESDVPLRLKLVIFRIIEEALSNVVRHARASNVEVTLMRVGDELLLWVRDNGSGFDTSPSAMLTTLRGIGLASIRKAVEATGGRLTLESSPQQGTRIGATWVLAPRAPG
jgi:two-component system NarL family sensor kinase